MNLNRRAFLKTAGAASTVGLFAPSILHAANKGEKVRLAMIGVGGRGRSHVQGMRSEHYVAFCDVDDDRAAETYMKYASVPRFKDFRVMFDKMGKDFDAVSVAVPDHMHYPIALWAMANGKHVLCEKPLVRTFDEAMLLKKAAQDSGVITQMGNQGHAHDGLRDIEEWIKAGVIGEVKEVYHWTNRPVWPQGMAKWPKAEPVPATMDWNLWLGVAPQQGYSEAIAPFKWRGYWNYGCGAIGDIACHAMDASYTPLKLGFPNRVEADTIGTNDITFPKASTIKFDFPARGGRGPIKMTWMDGGRRPKGVAFVPDEFISGGNGKKGNSNGSVIVGSKGSIFTDMYARQVRLFPLDYFRSLVKGKALPDKTLPRIGSTHFMEWIKSIKVGKQPGGNIAEYAADFTGTALLGAISLTVPGLLEFDTEALKFTNNEKANMMLKSQYPYRQEFIAG